MDQIEKPKQEMEEPDAVYFKANTRLKDLIGKNLILNDNVAIIELIKNSSDANSPEVLVSFAHADNETLSSETSRIKNADELEDPKWKDLGSQLDAEDPIVSDSMETPKGIDSSTPKSQLIVQDYGEGMSLADFNSKWLNIAFSAKRNQTHEKGRPYAGEKGVGRFSCDRLGRRLFLYSKKVNEAPLEAKVNWEDFELDDIDREIGTIKVIAREITESEYAKKVGHSGTGTKLEIRGLRSVWDEDKLRKLKKELERFIIDPEKKFQVKLRSTDLRDASGKLVFDAYVENRLFEKLDAKTTSVHSETVDSGKKIVTEIRHDGVTILEYTQENPFPDLRDLKVRVEIFYLNPGAKVSFKNITGYTSAEYGSIMMFLNGFRVMPYGDPDNDWLGLNMRKTQGLSRNLGGREVFGRVEVYDKQRRIVPVTSREGVEKNAAFSQLAGFQKNEKKKSFVHAAFQALEKYVVRGLDWDNVKPKDGSYSYEQLAQAMLASVDQNEGREGLVGVRINEDQIRQIAREKVNEYDRFIETLKRKVVDKGFYDLTPADKRNVYKYLVNVDARLQAAQNMSQEFKKFADVERKRRLFAESHQKPDSVKNLELVHHMRLLGDKIGAEIRNAISAAQKSANTPNVELMDNLQSALFNTEKLLKLGRIVSNADFDMMSDTLYEDVFSYIEQYIEGLASAGVTFGLNVFFSNPGNHELNLNFSPIEVSMVVDNVLDNAATANAANVDVLVEEKGSHVQVSFTNDGKELSKRYSASDLFNPGISTTSGSGIGLSQVKRVADSLEAEASIYNNEGPGVSVTFRWEK